MTHLSLVKASPEALRRLDRAASRFFSFRTLIACGETMARLEISPDLLPSEHASWEMLAGLARGLLDPLVGEFRSVELTYGFAASKLTRQIDGRIWPRLDQHAACERNGRGKLICERQGAAVDLRVSDRSTLEVAKWIRRELPFDRLYFYGADRPLHLSWHPEPAGAVVRMREGKAKRLIPQALRAGALLE